VIAIPRIAHPTTITDLSWRAAISLQPFHEIREPDFMLDADIADGDLHYIYSLRDASYPIVGSECRQSLRHGFI